MNTLFHLDLKISIIFWAGDTGDTDTGFTFICVYFRYKMLNN